MTRGDRSYIQTASGGQMWPLDPEPEDVQIEDIAHALANVCRFGGHTRTFYSVAQHSILVSQWCPPEYALWGLLHDAAEAYIGDMVRPIKYGSEVGKHFQRVEERLLAVIAQAFGLSSPEKQFIPEAVKAADDWILAAEARDLMGNPEWAVSIRVEAFRATGAIPPPVVPTIEPLNPYEARMEFLIRYYTLRSEGA